MIGNREVKVQNKDPNYAIKIEQAIAEKYGDDAVKNPKATWDVEKEQQYLDQLKESYYVDQNLDYDKTEVDGVFIPSKLLKEESIRSCPVCNTYSFKSNDDVYMTKFECCFKCYIQWVEGREERWNNGWRPKQN